MTLDRLLSTFPEGPDRDLIAKLDEFAKNDAGCGHEDFRLVSDGDGLSRAWFDGDTATARQFIVFGATASDGLFAFWLRDGSDPGSWPIGFLGSEGAGKVIARDFRQFLSLLAVSFDELELVFEDDAWTLRSEVTAELSRFREWLLAECQIHPPDDVAGLVSNAQSEHPSLSAFLEKWADKWYA